MMLRAAAAESVKVAADAVLAATNSRYAMLRRREDPLQPIEATEWRSVVTSVTRGGREPLRVLVITTIAQTIAAFFEKQLRILAEEGFEVHAVSSPGPALDNLAVGSSVIRHGIAMERKPDPLRDLKSLWNLLRLMRKVRPHIVHAHTPKAGLLGMLAARLAGVPVRLYTVHGLPLATRTGLRRRI